MGQHSRWDIIIEETTKQDAKDQLQHAVDNQQVPVASAAAVRSIIENTPETHISLAASGDTISGFLSISWNVTSDHREIPPHILEQRRAAETQGAEQAAKESEQRAKDAASQAKASAKK